MKKTDNNLVMIPALCVIFAVALFLCACGTRSYLSSAGDIKVEQEEETDDSDQESGDGPDEDSIIYVQVAGAVKSPGVFELPADSRVMHAIDAAGGFKKDADEISLNQAERLEDGQKIIVYTQKEVRRMKAAEESGDTSGSVAANESDNGLININSADRDLLMTLPGIGAAKAEAIIAYRQEKGSFSSADELKNVSGIGDAVYSRLNGLICT